MPGIFAPEQDVQNNNVADISVAPSAGMTGLTAALEGVSGLLQALPEESGRPLGKEDENRVLRPVAEKLRRLKQQRRKIGDTQYNVRVKTLLSSAQTTNPEYDEEIMELATNITGIDFSKATTPREAVEQGFLEFINTPEGTLASIQHQVYNEDGTLNQQATALGMQEAYHNSLARKDRAERLKVQAEMSGDLVTMAENEAKLNLPNFTTSQFQRAQQIRRNLLKGYLTTVDLEQPLNVVEAAGEIQAVISQVRTQFNSEANELGYSAFTDYNADDQLQPLLDLYDMLTSGESHLDNMVLAGKATTNMEKMRLGEALNAATEIGIGGYQDAMQEHFFSNVQVNELAVIEELAKAGSENSSLLSGVDDVFSPNLTPSPEVIEAATSEGPDGETVENVSGDTPNPYHEQARLSTEKMTPDQRNQMAVNGVTTFKSLSDPKLLSKENNRTGAVVGLAEGLLAVQVAGDPMTEQTFDKFFDEKFFKVYNEISKHDDENAQRLEAVTLDFFEDEAFTRLTHLQRDLDNSKKYQSIHLGFDDEGKVSLQIDGTFETSSAPGDVAVRSVMERFNIPFTTEALREFLSNQAQVGRAGQPTVGELRDITSTMESIRKLNKVMSVASRLGKPGKVVKERVKNEFNSREVVVESEEQLHALEPGTRWVLKNEGVEIRGVR